MGDEWNALSTLHLETDESPRVQAQAGKKRLLGPIGDPDPTPGVYVEIGGLRFNNSQKLRCCKDRCVVAGVECDVREEAL